ncbi:MAG: GNAT family N-acetyltransferase, partial [Planctomycetota bacterium]
MEELGILKLKAEDLPDAMNLLAYCITDMQAHGIDQWDEFYPTEEMIAQDIKDQSLYAIKNGNDLVAMVTINATGAPEYDTVTWLTENGKSLFVHRLAVHPDWHKKKIATKLMRFAEDYALDNNYVSIRLDVYSRNFQGVGLYESCGYKRTGKVY